MNSAMEYKGYTAVIRFRPDDDVFHGTVINVSDSVHFEGKSVNELKRAFKEAVDYYLAFCKKRGEEPEKPYSGKLSLRLEPDIHRKVALAAKMQGTSVNSFITHTLSDAVQRAGL
ncbi:MAG: type II toxin-antitoxin system HicB family antitoxin [Candidatus Hydrogenedentes bacterium]|nr:type II toxin-antitoxin system HicB family antitoxin [Candidatus Hydrogenedentota bacterium]